MDDLFNFSFSDFGAEDGSSGFDSIFNAFGGADVSNIAEQVAKFAFKQALGGGSSQSSPQQLFNSFAKQTFGGASSLGQSGSYFQLSSGQSMAQLASMIFRAHRRFM
jgi:hypothetical protein